MSVPNSLFEVQQWMGRKLAQPLSAPPSQEKECRRYLADHPGLSPHERIDLYRRLYWLRLYGILEQFFPFLLRLFGSEGFRETLAAPYLLSHPSTDWDLNLCGDALPAWIEGNYNQKDKVLVSMVARLDLAYHKAFTAPEFSSLTEVISRNQKLYLQPHVEALMMPTDFFQLRDTFLKESVSYWMRHPFPKPAYDRTYYFVFYRSPLGMIREEICQARYLILAGLKSGKTLEELALLVENESQEIYQATTTHLQEWFLEWTCNKWLTTQPS